MARIQTTDSPYVRRRTPEGEQVTADRWWATFFDDDYVTVWSAAGSFERTAEDADGIEHLLQSAPGNEVLDVACGFGRIAGQLHQRGYHVTGIDYSAEQLGLAQQRNPGPTYLQRDMREPPAGPYDAVLNIYSSFGYFADRRDDIAALHAWYAVLRPGGVLVMDLFHRDAVAYAFGGDDAVINHGPTRETGVTDWVAGRRTATITYGDISKTFRVRMYTATELVGDVQATGFTAVHVHGDLHGATRVSPATRLVIRATK